jgi:hypothetical protein
VSFRPNFGFERDMKRDPKYRAALRVRVEATAVPAVKRLADAAGSPWMPRGGRAITTEQDGDTVYIVNTDFGGHLVEWGSANNPAHAPLRRGVRAAGLRLREE